jgi:hypothetical protein
MNDESFEFDPGPGASSSFPAVLLAAVAIAAILFVNSPTLVSPAAAHSTAPNASSVKVMPALLEERRPSCAPATDAALRV